MAAILQREGELGKGPWLEAILRTVPDMCDLAGCGMRRHAGVRVVRPVAGSCCPV